MQTPPPNPTSLVKEIMEENGWNQTAFAQHLGVSLSNLSMALNGDRPLTAGLILKLGAKTRIPADVWAKRVSDYTNWSQSGEGQKALQGEGPKTEASFSTRQGQFLTTYK